MARVPSRKSAANRSETPKDDDAPASRPQKKAGASRPRKRRPRLRMPSAVGWLVLAGLLALGYIGYWAFVGMMFRQSIAAVIEAQRAQGLTISHGPAKLEGFPLRIKAILSDVSAVADPARGGWTVRTDQVVLSVSPMQPRVTRIELDRAPHRITLPAGPVSRTLFARADEAVVDVAVRGSGVVQDLTAGVSNLRVESASAGGVSTLERLAFDYAHSPLWDPGPRDVTEEVSLTLRNLSLAPDAGVPLGSVIEEVRVEAVALGPIPQDRSLDQALAAWRKLDGRVRLDLLSVAWPPLRLQAAGWLGLDVALQPEGALNARIEGFTAAIDSLHDQRVLRGRDATMAKVLLGGMARPGPDGIPRLEVPLVVRAQALWAGPVKVMALPRMPWGPPPGSLGAEGVRPGFEIDREGNIQTEQ